MSMNYMGTGLPGLLSFSKTRGYLTVELQTGPVKKRFTAHRLVMLAFVGPRPAGKHINHIDGDKANNGPANLEYVTPSENQKHSFRLGLQSLKGERHTQAKLTDPEIIEIRERAKSGETQVSIARDFGVAQSAISLIVRRKRWAHIPSAGEVRVVN